MELIIIIKSLKASEKTEHENWQSIHEEPFI